MSEAIHIFTDVYIVYGGYVFHFSSFSFSPFNSFSLDSFRFAPCTIRSLLHQEAGCFISRSCFETGRVMSCLRLECKADWSFPPVSFVVHLVFVRSIGVSGNLHVGICKDIKD